MGEGRRGQMRERGEVGRGQREHVEHAGQLHVRIGNNGETDRLAFGDLTDIGLIELGIDLHLAEVLGDGEQDGGRQASGDGLAGINGAVDDQTFLHLLEPTRPL